MSNENMCIPEEVYALLPELLRHTCAQLDDPIQKDTCLLTTLAVYGSMFCNYYAHFAGREIKPNLNLYIADGNCITGGVVANALKIADSADEERVAYAKDYREDYPSDVEHYNQMLASYLSRMKIRSINKNDNSPEPETPTQPEPPADYKYYVPTGISAAALMTQLRENKGFGLLCETGNGISNMNYHVRLMLKHLLTKCYYNEPVSYYHAPAKEDIRIKAPHMGVILSGSYEQLLDVIPNKDYGLHDKFCFYTVPASLVQDPFKAACTFKTDKDLLNHAEDIFIHLVFTKDPLYCILDEAQQKQLWQQSGQNAHTALTCLRIAMILTILHYTEVKLRDITTIPCTDDTLKCAIAITKVLHLHNTEVYNYLAENGRQPTAQDDTLEQQQMVLQLHEKGLSVRKIAAEVFGDEGKFMRVQRVLKAATT